MNQQLLNSNDVRAIFGNVSQMTLWRWLNDPTLAFPRPTVVRNRRYWDADELADFRNRMIASALKTRIG